MTTTELAEISSWCDLRDAMIENGFECRLTEYQLCESEDELMYLVQDAARHCWSTITELRYIDFDNLDSTAEAWLVSYDFSYTESMYSDEFDDYLLEFKDYLISISELVDGVDDEESDEVCKPGANEEVYCVPDAYVEALLFG